MPLGSEIFGNMASQAFGNSLVPQITPAQAAELQLRQQQLVQQAQIQKQAQQIDQFKMQMTAAQMQREAQQDKWDKALKIHSTFQQDKTPEETEATYQNLRMAGVPQELLDIEKQGQIARYRYEGFKEQQGPTTSGAPLPMIPPSQFQVLPSGPAAGSTVEYPPGGARPIVTPMAGAGMTPPSAEAKTQIWADTVINQSKTDPASVRPEVLKAATDWKQANELTPEAAQTYADLFLQTGQLPSMGSMGSAKIRTQVMNQIGETKKALGLGTGDIIAASAEVAANRGALASLSKQQASLEAFSGFLDRQLDTLDSTLKAVQNKVSLYNPTLLNVPIIQWEKNIQGSPEVQAYIQQLQSTSTEAARLVSSAGTTGAILPVQFEQEWQKIINPNAAPSRVEAFIRQMKIDRVNRTAAFEEQRKAIVEKFKKNQDPKRVQTFLNAMGRPTGGTEVPGTTDDVTQ